MEDISNTRGKAFEKEIEALLHVLLEKFPSKVSFVAQHPIELGDGRTKVIDFSLEYQTLSSRHIVAIECQDRETWSTEILDKIQMIRTYSRRNRFWFIYRNSTFLSSAAKNLLDSHGIIYFSLDDLRSHLEAVSADLDAADEWTMKNSSKNSSTLDTFTQKPPVDYAMTSGRN